MTGTAGRGWGGGPAGHVRLRFTDPPVYRSAAALREVTRDDEGLALQIPSDGSRRELRSLLDCLDAAAEESRGRWRVGRGAEQGRLRGMGPLVAMCRATMKVVPRRNGFRRCVDRGCQCPVQDSEGQETPLQYWYGTR